VAVLYNDGFRVTLEGGRISGAKKSKVHLALKSNREDWTVSDIGSSTIPGYTIPEQLRFMAITSACVIPYQITYDWALSMSGLSKGQLYITGILAVALAFQGKHLMLQKAHQEETLTHDVKQLADVLGTLKLDLDALHISLLGLFGWPCLDRMSEERMQQLEVVSVIRAMSNPTRKYEDPINFLLRRLFDIFTLEHPNKNAEQADSLLPILVFATQLSTAYLEKGAHIYHQVAPRFRIEVRESFDLKTSWLLKALSSPTPAISLDGYLKHSYINALPSACLEGFESGELMSGRDGIVVYPECFAAFARRQTHIRDVNRIQFIITPGNLIFNEQVVEKFIETKLPQARPHHNVTSLIA
jgi:hypothetical protein